MNSNLQKTCRLCGAPAVGIFYLDKGCACYPDDRTQALCAQHIDKATPIGSMTLIGRPPGVRPVMPEPRQPIFPAEWLDER